MPCETVTVAPDEGDAGDRIRQLLILLSVLGFGAAVVADEEDVIQDAD